MAEKDIKVPDIGGFKDVEVIEVMVKPGDVIAKEQGLITLEKVQVITYRHNAPRP